MTHIHNGTEGLLLFEPSLIKQLDWNLKKATFKDDVSPTSPGLNLALRPLSLEDYEKGYMNLMKQLTIIGDVPQEKYIEQFVKMRKCENTYYIIVVEDTEKSEIIASASLVLEQKFIHTCGKRGRIEDVVVSREYRGKQLGKLLLETLTLLGRQLGCYKLTLECKDDKVAFYESFGFRKDGNNFMVQRFKE